MNKSRIRVVVWAALAGCALAIQVARAQVEIVLRDSIGPDASTTDGNWPLLCTKPTVGAWWETLGWVETAESVTLTSVRVVMGHLTSDSDFSQLDYRIRFWSSLADAAGYPLGGGPTLDDVFFDMPTIGPTLFGATIGLPPGGQVEPTYELIFDLEPAGITFAAGQSLIIGFQVESGGGAAGGGLWGLQESTDPGNSDYYLNSSNPGLAFPYGEHFTSQHSGRLAWDVRGVPFCPEDLDCDGNRDLVDFDTFAAAMNGPDLPYGSLGCRSHDLDDDGDLDLADFSKFQVAFGSPCE